MVTGGTSEFPDVDPRFDVLPKRLFGPFWALRIVDQTTGDAIHVDGGSFLTGYGSVRRAAKHSTHLYLLREERRHRKGR